MYETDNQVRARAGRSRRRTAPLLLLGILILVGGMLLGRFAALPLPLSEGASISAQPSDTWQTQGGERAPDDADAEVLAALSARAEADGRFAAILERASSYPENLLALALKNEDAIDFVAAYPDHMQEQVRADAIDLSADCAAGGVPLLMQWDARWGYASYGGSLMGLSGCGPTCLSMVVSALTGDTQANPLAVAEYSEAQGWYVEGVGTDWELMRSGAAHYGLQGQELPLSEESMLQTLDAGGLIIASMQAGDFTDGGHFIVISGYSADGFQVRDPNSYVRSGQSWSYETLRGQISNLWAYSA